MNVTRSLFCEQLRKALEDFELGRDCRNAPSTSLRDLARNSRISAWSTDQHVEIVARLGHLVGHRLDEGLAAVLDGGKRGWRR